MSDLTTAKSTSRPSPGIVFLARLFGVNASKSRQAELIWILLPAP